MHGAEDVERAELWRELTRDVWRTRLKGVQRNVDVWQALLSVRQLVLPMHEDSHTYLKFASLCRKSGRVRSACPASPTARHRANAVNTRAACRQTLVLFGRKLSQAAAGLGIDSRVSRTASTRCHWQ